MESLHDPIVAFIRTIRQSEGFLSPSQIATRGETQKHSSEHHRIVAQRTQAQEAFGLKCSRQSRLKAWSEFSNLVMARLEESQISAPSSNLVKQMEAFRPSFTRCGLGKRQYQFIIVRWHALDQPSAALVEQVFRSATVRKKWRASGRTFSGDQVPVSHTSRVHLVPMVPSFAHIRTCFSSPRFCTVIEHQRTCDLIIAYDCILHHSTVKCCQILSMFPDVPGICKNHQEPIKPHRNT